MVNWECGFDFPRGCACWLGNFSSFCFFIVYIPQFILNFRRKSCSGFSLHSTIIKLIGSAFLCFNSLYNGAGLPVFLYGALNTAEHLLFLFQFSYYSSSKKAIFVSPVILIPFLLAKYYPESLPVTDYIKPITQIISHIPQLQQCIKLGTTLGCSLVGQHINMVGAFFGLMMCQLNNEKSTKMWLLYLNSIFQAVSLYILAILYNEMRFCDVTKKIRSDNIIEDEQDLLNDETY